MKCQRSGCREYGEQKLTLKGGYSARLCFEHKNEWADLCRAVPAWEESTDLLARESYLVGRAAAGDAPTIEEWRQFMQEQAANEATFYELAKEFCSAIQTESVF